MTEQDRDQTVGPVDLVPVPPPIPPIPPVPPALPVRPVPDVEGGGDDTGVYVQASVTIHGLHRQAELYFPEVPDDVTLAGEMWNAMCAVAGMQGAGVWMELHRRCATSGLT